MRANRSGDPRLRFAPSAELRIEMDAYDSLPPEARAAIMNAPLSVNAHASLAQIPSLHFDPARAWPRIIDISWAKLGAEPLRP